MDDLNNKDLGELIKEYFNYSNGLIKSKDTVINKLGENIETLKFKYDNALEIPSSKMINKIIDLYIEWDKKPENKIYNKEEYIKKNWKK